MKKLEKLYKLSQLIVSFLFLILKNFKINSEIMRKEKIVAKDKNHLKEIIKQEMSSCGHDCDLNHIDVSQIKDMSNLFKNSDFNGRLDKWNVSAVEDMSYMFFNSKFCGNIYNWDVSNVKDMQGLGWSRYFYSDVSNWKPYSLEKYTKFCSQSSNLPYWLIADKEERRKAIDSHHLMLELNDSLSNDNKKTVKKNKI